ncbi:hypothetical protein A6P39_009945 [Streptomyces sp. FXJ1.172]|uniref:hypothetical protein n=1 Tax=Streptomyces sp. FXJ1.172 TaxID=710705 RepID=UPI0007CF25B9|nr:hypothetical protein [Streptomyces sp. FXJ1.172]WEO94304.1 hypothetical protein A6P39_009945 [Streptomyces sp. FXJ1.172]
MSQVKTGSSDLPQPFRAVGSGLRRLPGAQQVSKAGDSVLQWIGAISPRGRRVAVYTGAGVLGVAGVVEWPVALTGAAVAWLTQPGARRGAPEEAAQANRAGNAENGQGGSRPGAAGAVPALTDSTDTLSQHHGPGDRLAPSHFHHESHPHEQPAKVGDSATASALKQVAEASAHHREPDSSSGHSPEARPR